jgi:hypothetical protein
MELHARIIIWEILKLKKGSKISGKSYKKPTEKDML